MSHLTRTLPVRLLCVAGIAGLFFGSNGAAAELGFDPAAIETITGVKGARNDAEGVFKVSLPRTDVPVTVEGWKIPPFMGLTSWAAFKAGGMGMAGMAMVMGDTVLFEDEVNPAMSAAFAHGLEVTALHNHFFFDEPKVYFMHIGGSGKAADLAAGVKAVWDAIAQTRAAHPSIARQFTAQGLPATNAVTAAPLEKIIGAQAQQNAGMVKFTIGREVKMGDGGTATKEMGVSTWAAFAGSDDNAVVDGDFAATGGELQAALKSLRADGIAIVAIHSHMSDDTPHLFFLHYWGRGRAADLAASVKRALATQGR
ncbi:MAG TPA: DUF1259 domain-containing protein [Opitutaceae bacterium]|nr:DUF1259 domain-containing protein [Opitutaceae bacterium]